MQRAASDEFADALLGVLAQEFALRQAQHEMLSYCVVRIAPFTLSLSKGECSKREMVQC